MASQFFEITVPGTWLDDPDKDWAWETRSLLELLVNHFYEANAALNLFVEAAARIRRSLEAGVAEWEARSKRSQAIELELAKELGVARLFDLGFARHEELSFEVNVRYKREQWLRGELPFEMRIKGCALFARSFVFALDAFDKALAVLKKCDRAPENLARLHSRLIEEFPSLRGIRNSVHHLEDRARGIGGDRKPMVLKPIDTSPAINSDGGALILGSLNGNKYGFTMGDGEYGEVEVSAESMRKLQGVLAEVLLVYRWVGPKQHRPG